MGRTPEMKLGSEPKIVSMPRLGGLQIDIASLRSAPLQGLPVCSIGRADVLASYPRPHSLRNGSVSCDSRDSHRRFQHLVSPNCHRDSDEVWSLREMAQSLVETQAGSGFGELQLRTPIPAANVVYSARARTLSRVTLFV